MYSKLKLWALWCEAIKHTNGSWTDYEIELYNQVISYGEGLGEKSYKSRIGLIEKLNTNSQYDIESLQQEIKCIENKFKVITKKNQEGKLVSKLQPIRLGKKGKLAWGKSKRKLIRSFSDEKLSESQWNAIDSGEVGKSILRTMPEVVQTLITEDLKSSNVLSEYNAIICVSSVGFLVVPRVDYSNAFNLLCISQMSPKYTLKRSYLENLLSVYNASNIVP
jgi:hypothetical protein